MFNRVLNTSLLQIFSSEFCQVFDNGSFHNIYGRLRLLKLVNNLSIFVDHWLFWWAEKHICQKQVWSRMFGQKYFNMYIWTALLIVYSTIKYRVQYRQTFIMQENQLFKNFKKQKFLTQKFEEIHRKTAVRSLFLGMWPIKRLSIEKATIAYVFFCEFCDNLSDQIFCIISLGRCFSTELKTGSFKTFSWECLQNFAKFCCDVGKMLESNGWDTFRR